MPFVVPEGTVIVRVLVEVVGFGLKFNVTPLGAPVALRLTLPVNPLTGTTVIVLVPLLPCWTLIELGLAVRLKSACATTFTTIAFDWIPFATEYKL